MKGLAGECVRPMLAAAGWIVGATIAAVPGHADEPVRFDVPALVAAREIPAAVSVAPDERLIEIVLPVSCWVSPEQRELFREFRFDIHWNRSVYPLVDYSPRTLMQSPVEGVVAVERQSRIHVGGVADIKGPMLPAQPAVHAEGSLDRSETSRFGEIPQHDILIASGTIQRGTGAFFRYHHSRQFALEGGREVGLVYRVARSWRGGILRVVCTASGSRRLFAGLTEPVRAEAAFMVAVHLDGDSRARDVAAEYVRQEQQLRAVWNEHLRTAAVRPRGLLVQFPPANPGSSGRLPESWVSDLVQSPLDDAVQRDADRLPTRVRLAAEDFLVARQRLTALSLPDPDSAGSAEFRVPTATWRPGPVSQPAAHQSAAQTRSPTSVVE